MHLYAVENTFLKNSMVSDIIIRANGTRDRVIPDHSGFYSIEELQDFVGGFIETVHLAHDKDHVLIVNEEGKLFNLPFNKDATIVAKLNDNPFEIVGDAFYCKKDRIE